MWVTCIKPLPYLSLHLLKRAVCLIAGEFWGFGSAGCREEVEDEEEGGFRWGLKLPSWQLQTEPSRWSRGGSASFIKQQSGWIWARLTTRGCSWAPVWVKSKRAAVFFCSYLLVKKTKPGSVRCGLCWTFTCRDWEEPRFRPNTTLQHCLDPAGLPGRPHVSRNVVRTEPRPRSSQSGALRRGVAMTPRPLRPPPLPPQCCVQKSRSAARHIPRGLLLCPQPFFLG